MYVLLVLLTYTTLPFSLGISNTRHRLMCIIRPSSGRAVLQNAVVVHVTSLYPFEGPKVKFKRYGSQGRQKFPIGSDYFFNKPSSKAYPQAGPYIVAAISDQLLNRAGI